MKVVIPFTLPGLNDYIAALDNSRYKGSQLKKEWQHAVKLALRRQIRGKLKEPIEMHYLWVERNQRRDKDNIAAFGRKVIQDALVEMRALNNDGWANIARFSDDFAVDRKKPRIEITILELQEE